MKISVINENEYIVYLNKYYYKYDKEKISNLMKNILAKLKKHYGIEVYSLFNVDCYIVKNPITGDIHIFYISEHSHVNGIGHGHVHKDGYTGYHKH